MIRAVTNCSNTTSPPQASSSPSWRYTAAIASSSRPIRDEVISNDTGSCLAETPNGSSSWPSAIRCAATAFNTSTSASVWADPKCSMSRDPRRDFHTTWTATAPDEVRTVRTYATGIPSRTRR